MHTGNLSQHNIIIKLYFPKKQNKKTEGKKSLVFHGALFQSMHIIFPTCHTVMHYKEHHRHTVVSDKALIYYPSNLPNLHVSSNMESFIS